MLFRSWGNSERDIVRIPVTALLLRILSRNIEKKDDWNVIERIWKQDLNSDVCLSYKGAFYLLGEAKNPNRNIETIKKTFSFIKVSQNQDGGFGPWKGHPIGSDPWSTGICLAGLCSLPEFTNESVIIKAAEWLISNQLPSGYWPYHFIDEGSTYAYWGLYEALNYFKVCECADSVA